MKSNMQVRIRRHTIPWRGKRIAAKNYNGVLPMAEPWPWQKPVVVESKP